MAPLRYADSFQRTAQVCPPIHFDDEQHLARAEPSARGGQTPGQTRPVKAVSRRSRARKARALTGVGWSGIGLHSMMRISFRSDRQDAKLAPVPATHRADLLTARENLRCCNVRRCQENCDKLLHWLTTDRGATLRLYPAIKRSIVCASPVLRYPSPNRHRTKTRTSRRRAGSARIWRS
jgi:hypothetical protein